MNDSYLCIDIGTSAIKALEKAPDGTILKWGILKIKDKPFHTSISPLDEGEAIHYLKILLEKMRSEGKEAVASVPAFLAFTAIAPAVDSRYIPAAIGTYKLDYIKTSETEFFLIATPNDVLEKYQRIFDSLGLKLLRLELESVALARTLGKIYSPALIIDIGYRSTTLTLAQRGRVNFVYHTDFAMASNQMDVIMNTVKEIAEKRSVKQIFSSSTFSIANGL
jgi:Tfp pilus assembly PilM family ATPase